MNLLLPCEYWAEEACVKYVTASMTVTVDMILQVCHERERDPERDKFGRERERQVDSSGEELYALTATKSVSGVEWRCIIIE